MAACPRLVETLLFTVIRFCVLPRV